ncbi:MAG: hypothetical protein L6Q40_11680 [Azonexus sp.]|nr:hypothetical protein [Azonexus sp.]
MMTGQLASQCGEKFPLRVMSSAAGYYIGTADSDGFPFSRESEDYWPTAEDAQSALDSGNWSQRMEA